MLTVAVMWMGWLRLLAELDCYGKSRVKWADCTGWARDRSHAGWLAKLINMCMNREAGKICIALTPLIALVCLSHWPSPSPLLLPHTAWQRGVVCVYVCGSQNRTAALSQSTNWHVTPLWPGGTAFCWHTTSPRGRERKGGGKTEGDRKEKGERSFRPSNWCICGIRSLLSHSVLNWVNTLPCLWMQNISGQIKAFHLTISHSFSSYSLCTYICCCYSVCVCIDREWVFGRGGGCCSGLGR